MAQPKFIWYDLMTSDAAAATTFYGAVIGWSGRDSGLTDRQYTVLSAGEAGVGGVMEWGEAGRQPGWIGYVGVDDVDATAQRVADAGGAVHHPPEDIPGVGRFAVVADPQGAAFMLFKGAGQAMPSAVASTPGHVGWHELHATDQAAALPFYADLFGWTKSDVMDMGEMGVYQMFAADGVTIGGMMTRTAADPVPYWLFYVNVNGIDAAVSRLQAHGGRLLNGPHQVPGGSWIIHALDPQGALFALVSNTR